MRLIILYLFLILILCLPNLGYAYIGPGLGTGTIGLIIGIIASVFLALFAIIWYPIKRLIKKKKTDASREILKP